MSLLCDETLVPRLPLPLAQLYRRAHNAHRAKDRKETAYCLWEASIKLLGCVCVCEYAQLDVHDPRVDSELQKLARPALGHWVGFIRQLLPILRDHKIQGFDSLYDSLTRKRDDLPRLASMDAWLRQSLEGKPSQRIVVTILDVFARLTQFRNQEVGHGAIGQRDEEFYHQVGHHLLAGAGDLLSRIDLLAGRRLFYLQDLRRDGGLWISHRLELIGESPRRVLPLTWPAERGTPPVPQAVYLDTRPANENAGDLCSLQPLVVYDEDQDHLLFLNSQRGSKKTEYLCYHTGEHPQRPDLGGEHRALLRRVLNLPALDEDQMGRWAERLAEEEVPGGVPNTATEENHRRIGEFELLAEVGRGGQSIVYRALQPSLNREVALKRLLLAGNPNTERHFQREIRALARVDHPNLIKIFTSGVDNEQWYYAMELIEGADLGEISARLTTRSATSTDLDLTDWQDMLQTACEEARKGEKPLSSATRPPSPRPGSVPDLSLPDAPPEIRERLAGEGYISRIVELMRQVALATQALHEADVIHRDIKPANIMVDRKGERAVLMDLGLAKLSDASSLSLSASIGGGFVGTLRYASPEQALPQMNVKVDPRSDIYSIGATLWELLTLKPLFATNSANDPQLLRKIQQDDPPPLRSILRSIHPDLEAIVAHCLEKDPARRYQSAAELAADIKRYQNGEPISIRPVGRIERAWRYFRRRPLEAALVGVCVLGLLAVGTIVAREAINAAVRDRIARVNAVALSAVKNIVNLLESDQFKRDPGVQPFRKEMLSSLEALTVEMRNDPRASEELADLFLKIGTISRILDAADNGNEVNGRERALQAFTQAVDLTSQPGKSSINHIKALLKRGELHTDESRWDAALQDLLTAERELGQMRGPLQGDLLDLHGEVKHQLGRTSHNQGNHSEALRYYKEARQARADLLTSLQESSETDWEELLRARNNLARVHGFLGDTEVALAHWTDAQESYQRSEDLREQLRRDAPRNPEFRFQLARSYGNTANLERARFHEERLEGLNRAIEAYQKAIAVQIQLVQENKAVVDYRSDAINNSLHLARLRLYRSHLAPDRTGADAKAISQHLTQAEKLLGSDDSDSQIRPFRRARCQMHILRAYLLYPTDPVAALEYVLQADRFYRREGDKLDSGELYDLTLLEAIRGMIDRQQGRVLQADRDDTDALAALRRAFDAGYRNTAWVEREPVLAGIRERRPVQWREIIQDR